jgi:ribosome biogenesis SPOUT family RNA methylase Rps3
VKKSYSLPFITLFITFIVTLNTLWLGWTGQRGRQTTTTTTNTKKRIAQVQASVALKRIDVFMNREELRSKVEVVDDNASATGGDDDDDSAIVIDNGTFCWENGQV